jgi:membrane protease YdiL (CAAX protease family)
MKVLLAYFGTAFLLLLCGYFFPAEGGPVSAVPIVVSVTLLFPFYIWYRGYRQSTELSKEVKIMDRDTVILWVFALFVLALSVRIPSVLLFGAPYEKTPVILLTILAIAVIEKTDISVFGFTAKRFGRSLVYGLAFFLLLNTLSLVLTWVLIFTFTGQVAFQAYDPLPFVSAMPFMTLCVGISEEGLFRGYMQTRLEKAFTLRKAIVFQALLFGAWHFVWNLQPFDLPAMMQYVTITFFIGLLFGYFYTKTRNLTPLIFAHGLWDSVAQGIQENTLANDALRATAQPIQILIFALPYAVAAVLTFLFVKYLVRRLD